MNIDEILKHNAFQALDKEKIELYKELADKLNGKSQMESIGILMEYQKKISSQNPLNKEEKAAVLSALQESMPEENRKKFNQIIKMMETME